MLRVVFMGTPEFAVPSLCALHLAGHQIAGVFCQPDRPSGRGNRLAACPVKEEALRLQLPVYQFERIRRQEGLDALRALRPDVCVTAAFGQILSRKNLDVSPMGTINVHASLLPRYRGAAPVQWAVMNGERVTGVTTMQTDEGVDTGDMLLRRAVDIGPNETAGELLARLAGVGAQLVVETLALLMRGGLRPQKQDETEATHVPMLRKEHGLLNFRRPAQALHNQVRGVNPWPGAYAGIGGQTIKIWQTRALDGRMEPGTVMECGKRLIVACGEGALEILEMQAAGSRRMTPGEYLLGHALSAGRFDVWEETT